MPSPREEEPRRRKKDYDRETSSRTSRTDKDRHRSSGKKSTHGQRSSTSRDGSPEGNSDRLNKSSVSDLHAKSGKKVTMVVPEMERRSSVGTRSSVYPTFSKEHSREAVSRENVATKSRSSQEGARSESPAPPAPATVPASVPAPTPGPAPAATSTRPKTATPTRDPPSPPLTEEEIEAKRANRSPTRKRTTDRLKADSRRTHKSSDSLRPVSDSTARHQSSSHRSKSSPEESDGSEMSERGQRNKSKSSGSTGYTKSSYKGAREASSESQDSLRSSTVTQHTEDSQATSVPDKKPAHRPPGLSTTDGCSPSTQSSPRTPMSQDHFNPNLSQQKGTPVFDVNVGGAYSPRSMGPPPRPGSTMPPPPPPPPIVVPEESPRVDYLLQNGGLPHPVPKTLLPVVTPQPIQSYQQYHSPRMDQGKAPNDLVRIFAPVHNRLEDYMKVLSKNGSIAVATGYRSVARRLLDRLETVFARNISSERCYCAMCGTRPYPQTSDEEEKGISWGEILEFVAGRRELPQWPPFSITAQSGGLGIRDAETPMQNIDPDVPPEWRDHYKKQNAKTKRAVEGWLSQSEDTPTNAPTEVDDETLTFAILTHIEPDRRPVFVALKKGLSEVPSSGGRDTPLQTARNDVLQKVSLALTRLYRLPIPPREAESCIYLLNNPQLHNTLSTLAAVTVGEWEILVSGRFDGFLWSGAETGMSSSQYGSAINMPYGPSRNMTGTPLSRNTTPFSAAGGVPLSRGNTPFSPLRNVVSPDSGLYSGMFPSRGTTPAPGMAGTPMNPAPVQMDEETEIMMLAEIEREIFRGMEELEDQFEKLHYQAEAVRQRLRERGAGLAMAAQARRGSITSDPGVRGGTPMSMGAGGWNNGVWTPEPEGSFFDDGRSELAPDDSASNIGARRHRRDGRHSRRTPAPVAEEDEEVVDVVGEKSEKKTGGFFRRR